MKKLSMLGQKDFIPGSPAEFQEKGQTIMAKINDDGVVTWPELLHGMTEMMLGESRADLMQNLKVTMCIDLVSSTMVGYPVHGEARLAICVLASIATCTCITL